MKEEYRTPQLKPHETFSNKTEELDFTIREFWAWNQSDLVENRNRGILAEFIVMKALGIKSEQRLEWDDHDLKTENGVKIEVKSAAYIQSWKQKDYSKISFDISPKKSLLDDNNYSNSTMRHADVYVFCVLNHKDQGSINPMDVSQWDFYLTKTSILDEKLGNQKTITLSSLKNLNPKASTFRNLRNNFERQFA